MTDLVGNTADWPDEGVVFPIRSVDISVSPAPHPFHLAEKDGIAENWDRERAANPALFDGRMVLQRAIRIADGAIVAQAHIVPFSAFLLWRRSRTEGAMHLFGLPVIVSSDGAVIAIRMGPRTANPGRVYCAAGSLDEGDVRDGRCDLDGNMAREVREETGMDLSLASDVSSYQALHIGNVVTVFRCYRFTETAQELIALIARHIAGDPEPEIDEALAIRSPDPSAHAYPPFMPPVLEWVLARSKDRNWACG